MSRKASRPDKAAAAPPPAVNRPPVLRSLWDQGLLTDDLTFVDVGCSGGIDPRLRAFEPALRGVGFDPLVKEIARLKDIETQPKIAYVDAWIGAQTGARAPGDPGEWRTRTSGQLAFNIMTGQADGYDSFVRAQFNRGDPLVYAERRIALSDYLHIEGPAQVDVLKIDTDGQDLNVLRGAAENFRLHPPLLITVECNMNGANLFSETDRLIRDWGLMLLEIEPWRYTRRSLPGRFFYDLAAQTDTGPTAWCDLRYVDDPLAEFGRLDRWLRDGRLQRCLKLIALYETYGLPDCAAELILALRAHATTRGAADWDRMLDLLVPANPFGAQSYADYMAAFHADPSAFFPTRWPR
jgi:FkbM family methyltransferase